MRIHLALAGASSLCLSLLWGQDVSAHVGGTVTRPVFSEPIGVVEVTQANSVTFTWEDDDADPTGVFGFHYQAVPGPSIRMPDETYLDGVEFATATVSDPSNTLDWDLSEVPPGAYHVYVQTIDPPLCYAVRYAPALIVVRPAPPGNSAAPFGLVFESPSVEPGISNGSVDLELAAIAPSTPTLDVLAGGLLPSRADGTTNDECIVTQLTFEPAVVAASDVKMELASSLRDDFWRAVVTWDTTDLTPPAGSSSVFYFVRAEATLATGETATAYLHKWIEVLPAPDDDEPDTDVTGAPSADGTGADVGPSPVEEEPTPDPGGNCSQSGGSPSSWPFSALLVTLGASALRRGQRRLPRTPIPGVR